MSLVPRQINAQQNCPLFLLSQELRDKIYKLAFPIDTEETSSANKEPIHVTRIRAFAPSNGLMASCYRLWIETSVFYAESRRAFWRSNRFLIPMEVNAASASSPVADLKLIGLGFKHFELIQRVTIRVSGPDFVHNHHFGPGPNMFVGICLIGFDFNSSSSLDPGKLRSEEAHEKVAVINAVGAVLKARASAVAAKVGRGSQYVAAARQYLRYVARERELNGNEKGLLAKCEAAEDEVVEKAEEESVLMKKAVVEGAVKHFIVRHNAGVRQG